MKKLSSLQTVILIVVLQVLGVASGISVAKMVMPNFWQKYDELWLDEEERGATFHIGSKQMLNRYQSLQIFGYIPFLFASCYVFVVHGWKFPMKPLQKLRGALPLTVFVVAVLMLSGVFYDWLVPEANPKWGFTLISCLYGAGLFGILCMYSARKKKKPQVLFVLGLTMLIMAYVLLELLLLTRFGK